MEVDASPYRVCWPPPVEIAASDVSVDLSQGNLTSGVYTGRFARASIQLAGGAGATLECAMPKSNPGWPRKGDKAFEAGHLSLDLDFYRVCGLDHTYADAFSTAAEALVERLADDARSRPMHVAIVIAYLYRHYLELQLKLILQLGAADGLVLLKDDDLTDHRLHPLWNKVRPLVEENVSGATDEVLDTVGSVVQQFHLIDPSGQEFRYADTKDRQPSLERLPGPTSVVRLKAVMAKVIAFLDHCEVTLRGE